MNPLKKVLIITYYWPPSGGSGVQRCLKFVKYLRDFGWEPVVYTVENGEYPVIDTSLEKEIPAGITVLKTKAWEPYSWYKKFLGLEKESKISAGFLSEKKKNSLLEKVAVWIRGNFFIPDARKFWIRPSVNYLKKYLSQNPVDVIFTSGPPHSVHLIGLGLKKELGIRWLADFRDPWTTIDFYDKLLLTKFSDTKHKKLELEVLKNADKVITISHNGAKDFQKIFNRDVEVITNGFDEEDFKTERSSTEEKFSLTHIGSLNKDRNPENLWLALKELCEENETLRKDLLIRMIGVTDISAIESIRKNNLYGNFEKVDYVAHDRLSDVISKSQILLLLVNNTPNAMGVIPGKLFEYLASERPVLCIGPVKGDSAIIIRDCNVGTTCDFNDKEGMKSVLRNMYSQYKEGKLSVNASNIYNYSRKILTQKLSELLNQMI